MHLATSTKSIFFQNELSKKDIFRCLLVEEDGFEPSKHYVTDLQSAPFGHSGTPPYLELAIGIEPTTC